jgi:predicted nucleotidyltransferase
MAEESPDDPGEAAVRRFAGDVRRRLSPWVVDLLLYGSRARGTAVPWSDWDILALTTGRDRDQERELVGIAYDYLLSDRVNISVKWMPVVERDRQLAIGAPFVRNVMRDGKSLWTSTAES